MARRPLGITLLGTLAILAGLGILLVALTNLFAFLALAGARVPPVVPPGTFLVNAIVGFALAAYLIVRGRGFLKLQTWAWWVTILPIVVGIFLGLFALLSGAGSDAGAIALGPPGLILLIALFIYFMSVRKHFQGIAQQRANETHVTSRR